MNRILLLLLSLAAAAWPAERSRQDLIDLVGRKGDYTHLYDLYQRAGWVTPQEYGAKADDTLDDYPAIQAAVNAKKQILIPQGRYRLRTRLDLRDSTLLQGVGSRLSVLYVAAGDSLGFMVQANGVHKWAVQNLGFDNYANYPNPDSVASSQEFYEGDVFPKPINTGIRVLNGSSYWAVRGCWFYGLTGHGVLAYQTATPYHHVRIERNDLEYGAFMGVPIVVYGGNGGALTRDVQVVGNTVWKASCNRYIRPGIQNQNAYNDGIHLDQVRTFVVSGNTVRSVSGIGIRIEQCENGEVFGNVVDSAGKDGITVYHHNYDVGVIGNTVTSFGRIPSLATVRRYAGALYMPREEAHASLVPLPANPSTSPWWTALPYSLQGTDTTYIPTYDTNNYYSSTPFTSLPDGGDITNQANFQVPSIFGLLAFRGWAGISVNQESERIRVIGNRIVGDTTRDGMGRYYFGSEYGISAVHNENNPVATRTPFIAQGNIISKVTRAEIYVPEYEDPINMRGPITGRRVNDGNFKVNASAVVEEYDEKVYSGAGTPEGALTAPVGRLYIRTNGGASTTLYVKESGTGNTGWVAK